MDREAVRDVNRLGDVAAESGRIPKAWSARRVMPLLSGRVQRGCAEIYARSGLVMPHEQGLRYGAGLTVPS